MNKCPEEKRNKCLTKDWCSGQGRDLRTCLMEDDIDMAVKEATDDRNRTDKET
jgi:hypothetical protein